MTYADEYIVKKEKLSNIADAIRNNASTEELITVDEMPSKVKEVFDAGYNKGKAEGGNTEEAYNRGIEEGKQAEYDRFWDGYQNNGKSGEKGTNGAKGSWVCAFAFGWTDETYTPKYNIVGRTGYGLRECFRNSTGLTDTKVPLIDKMGNLAATFNYCSGLKRIPLLRLEVPVTDISASSFDNCYALEEINIECVGNGCFAASITFEDCSKLTTGAESETSNSVQSIIDALMTIIDGKARTITFNQTVRDKLTPTQELTITGTVEQGGKGWTLLPARTVTS
jgi:hypothetical protein